MDINWAKKFAGLEEGTPTPGQRVAPTVGNRHVDDLITKLDSVLLTGNTNTQLDLIYQWVKTGHVNLKQFHQLINWWIHQMEDNV